MLHTTAYVHTLAISYAYIKVYMYQSFTGENCQVNIHQKRQLTDLTSF